MARDPIYFHDAFSSQVKYTGHQAALERIVQAGAQPTSWVQLLCELQRDWARTETAQQFAEILFAVEGH